MGLTLSPPSSHALVQVYGKYTLVLFLEKGFVTMHNNNWGLVAARAKTKDELLLLLQQNCNFSTWKQLQ